jgi:hypothetical protein
MGCAKQDYQRAASAPRGVHRPRRPVLAHLGFAAPQRGPPLSEPIRTLPYPPAPRHTGSKHPRLCPPPRRIAMHQVWADKSGSGPWRHRASTAPPARMRWWAGRGLPIVQCLREFAEARSGASFIPCSARSPHTSRPVPIAAFGLLDFQVGCAASDTRLGHISCRPGGGAVSERGQWPGSSRTGDAIGSH